MDEIVSILKELGIPYAYDHFAEGEGPDPPFACYRIPESNNFSADGMVYLPVDVIDIELYTDEKDRTLEQKLERLLSASGFFWNKDETWIPSEKLYEVIYEFEKEADDAES